MLTTLPPSCAVVMKSGNLNFLEPSGPLQACNGTALPLPLLVKDTASVIMVVILREALNPGLSEQGSTGVQALQVSGWLQKLASGTTVCCSLLLGAANGGLPACLFLTLCIGP